MSAWRRHRIGELGRVVTGKTPPSSRPELFEGSIPFITPSDMATDLRHVDTERHVSSAWDIRGRSLLPPGAVCVVCIGATIGKICQTSVPSQTNQQINSIIVDRQRFDERFVYYVLRSKTDELKAKAAGAATPIINKSTFSEIVISAPQVETQRRIGAVLGAYDDLIQINRRRVAVLEEMARGLFEEWFVRFRFPGHERVPLAVACGRSLPREWAYYPVGETIELLGGGTPSKVENTYWEGGTVDWYTPSDLTGAKTLFMDRSAIRITPEGLARSSAKLFPADSLMMTSRATIGAIAINTGPASTNQGFITCLPNSRVPRSYLYYWLIQNVPVFISHATGATFKEITKGVFRRLPMMVPAANVVQEFERHVRPMHDMILMLERSNRRLAASRDLLLPRLISGQLAVEVAVRELEEAA